MEIIEFTENNISEIFRRIRNDLRRMRNEGIPTEHIKISMPTFVKNMLGYAVGDLYGYHQGNDFFDQIDGVTIVSGYNNQICVFHDMANHLGPFAEPIKVEFNVKQKENTKAPEKEI